MKVAYKHLVKYIDSNPSIEDLSSKLFQLGHEHEIDEQIYDIEFTPNRGDCLSLLGLLRDLRPFYKINFNNNLYDGNIQSLKLNFKNNVKNNCTHISFLKIEVDDINEKYKPYFNSYFEDLQIKKNNFFTDISNYLSYETGQPTHCYDATKIGKNISLDFYNDEAEFTTLLGKTILLKDKNLVFMDDKKLINLAGVIGSKDTACDASTKSVIIECAYFNPEAIVGKSVKYDLNSDAAYKFERGVDSQSHEYVLRRFLNIVDDHSILKKVELYSENLTQYRPLKLEFNINKIKNIIGFDISDELIITSLQKLGFTVGNKELVIPSHRNDIEHENDIAEEVARVIGYNDIPQKKIDLSFNKHSFQTHNENKLKHILIQNGFNEVINYPFVSDKTQGAIEVDNPLDSSKKYLRTSLKNSLINNLLYNERRQKDSIKLFEVSDIYCFESIDKKRVLGIIASGRLAKNYKEFSKIIKKNSINSIFANEIDQACINFFEVQRQKLDSKSNNPIVYAEIELDRNIEFKNDYVIEDLNLDKKFKKYQPISEYPSSYRDLSFSIKDFTIFNDFKNFILNFEHNLLKEVFVFDFYNNQNMEEIKIGFRFIFQSREGTITDDEVNAIIKRIVKSALEYNLVTIPGMIN